MLSRTLPLRRLAAKPALAIARTYISRHDPAGNPSIGTAQPPRPDSAGYGDLQKSKPLNPHLPNPPSTNGPHQGVSRVGIANAPPELVSAADTDFTPENSEDIQRVVGGQLADQDTGPGLGGSFGREKELGVGEMAEVKFRIEPLRRQGEDLSTMRARLLYQSRKRGILETDLLLSTFADAHLPTMSLPQLQQYDLFLDENDWDIYYWTTQHPPPTSAEYAKGGPLPLAVPTAAGHPQPTSPETPTASTPAAGKHADAAAATSQGQSGPESQPSGQAAPQSEPQMQGASSGTNQPGFGEGPVGEWAQTVGRVKEPYRPPPSRWRDSEILKMLRAHVRRRKSGDGIAGSGQRGLGRMPDVRQF